MFKNIIAVTAGSFVMLISCAGGETKKESVKKQRDTVVAPVDTTPVRPAYPDNKFNNISGIISGVKEEGNPIGHLFDSASWKQNAEFMSQSWGKLNSGRLNAMRKWASVELEKPNKECKTVFYPFSGPDFITADCFFPESEKLIMLGLEPVGALPVVDKMSGADAADYSNDLKKSLTDIFEKSYFITQYMLRDFQKQKVNGTLPVLCFFMKRTGHQILDIKYLVRKNNDTITEEPYDTKEKPFGARILCERDGIKKSVYYFRYDVSNKLFNDTTVFYRFIKAQTPGAVTFVKSASYLLHANFMGNMKKLILANSSFILEDDTGIPYDDISKSGQFDISLYGEYSQPVKNFPYLKLQKSIVKAYEKDSASVPRLPFHLGYHWQTQKDVLIFASRKKS